MQASTLWAEARGEGRIGMEAVANVIANRARLQWHGAAGTAAVCLAPRQFSCWNAGDPHLVKMERVMRSPDALYLEACDIARRMLAGELPDRTDGATHYFASTLRVRPNWAQGRSPCRVIGNHEFYKDIA
jgi:spore germination cell wall hydrolase CwlJ-like protein